MLSPRRVKPTPTVLLYELRMIRPSTRSEKMARLFEGCVKKWRGVARWYLQAHTSARGEAVMQIVGERHTHVSRIDNLFTSWRRALGKELQLPKAASLRRATWTAIGPDNFILDVRVMHDVFDAATAKLWAEIASAADATRCSYIEPAMPPFTAPPSREHHIDKQRVGALVGPVHGPVGHAHAPAVMPAAHAMPKLPLPSSKSASGPQAATVSAAVVTKTVVLGSA
jgi:hypothetical protein